MRKSSYLTFKIEDLVSTFMILNHKTKVPIEELFKYSQELNEKMEKQNIMRTVMFDNIDLKCFALKYSGDFDVTDTSITLNIKHNIDWLIKKITAYLSLDKLEFLGFVNNNDNDLIID